MKILSITAQKPNSTGSGVYLTELVKGFARLGHEQAVLAGIYEEDKVEFPEGVSFYPVCFRTEKLPFAIAGMSDQMPYESTIYGQMTPEMVAQFKTAFKEMILKAAEEFQPDLIVCHHLYLLTALVREVLPGHRVYGFCHNTDLRQMKKIPLERAFIKEQIQKLERIFALHEDQKKEIMELYDIPAEKIVIAGTGFNSHIFYLDREVRKDESSGKIRLIFAGKLSEKKGVMSFMRSLSYLPWQPQELEVCLAGGYGDEEEYVVIQELAKKSPYKVRFLGRLTQVELAKEYNKSDVFVLPSFSEGMPLTMMEAMACGNKVVITDLPGIRSWVMDRVPMAPVVYVTPPKMYHTDEAVEEDLPRFERELAAKIEECVGMSKTQPDLRKVSWENVCEVVLGSEAECGN